MEISSLMSLTVEQIKELKRQHVIELQKARLGSHGGGQNGVSTRDIEKARKEIGDHYSMKMQEYHHVVLMVGTCPCPDACGLQNIESKLMDAEKSVEGRLKNFESEMIHLKAELLQVTQEKTELQKELQLQLSASNHLQSQLRRFRR